MRTFHVHKKFIRALEMVTLEISTNRRCSNEACLISNLKHASATLRAMTIFYRFLYTSSCI